MYPELQKELETFELRTPKSAEAHKRNLKRLPLGVASNYRAYDPYPIFVKEGRGSHFRDLDGNDYIDHNLCFGALMAGHCHPAVINAVEKRMTTGTMFGMPHDMEWQLAEEICKRFPVEMVRFGSSGTEATMHAVRLARAATGRDKILKFEGGYHGMSDYGLMSLAPKRAGNFPQPIPDSAGIPKSIRDEVLVAPFNDLETVASLIREHKNELAGIIVEPFQRLIPPKPGFLEGLRKLTQDNGLLLIFDEVVTGFRFAYGGAQAYYGVVPDICTLGKAIGGGFPLAAIAGRADIMAHFDKGKVGEDRFMMQVGTLSGNPVAAAAGLKTLEILKRPGAYEQIFKTGRALMTGYAEILKSARVKARVVGDAPMFDIVFTDREVSDYRSAMGDEAAMKRCNQLLRDRGILKGESKYYISLAHTEEDVRFTLEAFAASIAELQRARAA
jgi:glutamate-1-semialdehyde 2,1-aminomutase